VVFVPASPGCGDSSGRKVAVKKKANITHHHHHLTSYSFKGILLPPSLLLLYIVPRVALCTVHGREF
jgi:hypothetical protein